MRIDVANGVDVNVQLYYVKFGIITENASQKVVHRRWKLPVIS